MFCNGFAKDARGLDDKRNAVQNPNSQGIKAGSGFREGTDIPSVPPLFPIMANLEIFCKKTLKKALFRSPFYGIAPFMELGLWLSLSPRFLSNYLVTSKKNCC